MNSLAVLPSVLGDDDVHVSLGLLSLEWRSGRTTAVGRRLCEFDALVSPTLVPRLKPGALSVLGGKGR